MSCEDVEGAGQQWTRKHEPERCLTYETRFLAPRAALGQPRRRESLLADMGARLVVPLHTVLLGAEPVQSTRGRGRMRLDRSLHEEDAMAICESDSSQWEVHTPWRT